MLMDATSRRWTCRSSSIRRTWTLTGGLAGAPPPAAGPAAPAASPAAAARPAAGTTVLSRGTGGSGIGTSYMPRYL